MCRSVLMVPLHAAGRAASRASYTRLRRGPDALRSSARRVLVFAPSAGRHVLLLALHHSGHTVTRSGLSAARLDV